MRGKARSKVFKRLLFEYFYFMLVILQGDSGGPIQFDKIVDDDSSIATVVGIISFGVDCGYNLPGVYTRVANYREWIESVVWPFH